VEPGKRFSNCWAREVAEARWPPPVSEERKRTLSDFLSATDGAADDDGSAAGSAVASGEAVVLVLPSSLPLQSVREGPDDREEKILSIIL